MFWGVKRFIGEPHTIQYSGIGAKRKTYEFPQNQLVLFCTPILFDVFNRSHSPRALVRAEPDRAERTALNVVSNNIVAG